MDVIYYENDDQEYIGGSVVERSPRDREVAGSIPDRLTPKLL